MSTGKIPRALVKHFLRANGSSGEWIKEAEFYDPADVMDAAGAYRLGLCAAAEMVLEHLRFIYSNNPKMDPTDPVKLIAVILEDHAEKILKRAGVDPEAWEKARCT